MEKGIGKSHNNLNEKKTSSSICLKRIISQLESESNTTDLHNLLQEIFQPSLKESLDKKCNSKDSGKFSERSENELGGFLLAFENLSKKIIFASHSITKFLNYKETELLDKKFDEILHPKSGKKLESIFSPPQNNSTDLRSIKPFNCQFQRKEDANNNSLDIVEMICSCICAPPKSNLKFSDKDVNGDYCICLATPLKVPTIIEEKKVPTRGPPNQTIHTRTEIPQPEIFKTRHDIVSGEIVAIENHHNLSGAIKDELIRRCLFTLNEVRSNGVSLIQSLIRQALGVGQATTPAYKFRLAGGGWVTAQSKSSLVNQSCDKGNPMFIVSTHSIYRDGSLEGLNLNGISPSMRNILTAPAVSNSSTTFSSANTVTTATVRTSSFSNFSTIPNVSFPDSLNCLPTWSGRDQFRPRNSTEVARELLVSTGADHNNAEELANSVLSPPPHLDGHLVHAIGGIKTKSSLKSTNTSKDNKASPTDNLATFPGPPCVDLSNFKLPEQNAGLVPSAPMFVNGITTMRMEAAVATNSDPLADPLDCKPPSFGNFEKPNFKIEKSFPDNFSDDALSSSSATITPPDVLFANPKTAEQKRVITPPEVKSFSAPISPVVTRPRSASTNNVAPSVSKSLKRSASTSSQDGGIAAKLKPKHFQPRRRSKDAKTKPAAAKDTILSQLLKCKDLPDEIVSTALGTLASKQPRILARSFNVKSEIGNAKSIFPTTNIKSNHITTSIHLTHAPLGTAFGVSNFSAAPIFTQSTVLSSPGNSAALQSPHLPSFSEATSVSKEELDELDDILESLNGEDIFSPSFGNNESLNPPQFQPQHTTNILENILENNVETSSFQAKNFNSDPIFGVQHPTTLSNPVYFTSSPQNMPMINPNPSPQTLIGTPNLNTSPNNVTFMKNTSSQMFSGGGVSPIVEQCPNKTITPNGAMNQRVPPQNLAIMGGAGNAPLYRGMNGQECWEGKEPLVDLGSIPPPHGVNPRLPIPTNFNLRANGIAGKMLREQQNRQVADMNSYQSFGPISANSNPQSAAMSNLMSPSEMMTSPNPRVNGAPGFAGNIRHQTYDVRPGMQNLTNGNGATRSNQDLRHQLHLRLHQPNTFDGDRSRAIYNVHPRTDMTSSGMLAQQKNEYFMRQKMIEQRMENNSVMSSSGRDGIFMSGPQNIVRIPNQFQRQNSYSPRQQFSPPVGAMHSVRPQMMTSYNPAILRQNSAPNYPGAGSPQSPMLTPNLGKNLSSPSFNSPPPNITPQQMGDKGVLVKTPTKRTRVKKTRKSAKSKSTLNLAKDWNGNVGNLGPGLPGLYSHGVSKPIDGQSSVIRMGNMPQRPIFTAGAFPQMSSSTMTMTSPPNNVGQTINLNLMIDQNNIQDPLNNPGSSFLKSTPDGISESFNWSDAGSSLDVGIDLNNLSSTLDSGLDQGSISLNNGGNNLSFFGGVALNSNTNNNNNPPPCRYMASVTSSPIAANDVTPLASPMKRTGQRKTSLLETLLLS